LYGIPRVVVDENVNFQGLEAYLRQRGVDAKVLGDPDCIALMQEFIESLPEIWSEDINSC